MHKEPPGAGPYSQAQKEQIRTTIQKEPTNNMIMLTFYSRKKSKPWQKQLQTLTAISHVQ